MNSRLNVTLCGVVLALVANLAQADDSDGDGIIDTSDNCTEALNPGQLDTDGDNIGNQCDCDFNQDNFCGGPDFTIFIGCFNAATGGNPSCEAADMNGDNFVGGPDFTLFIGGFNGPPGPSGTVGVEPAGIVNGVVGGTTVIVLDDNDSIVAIDDTADRAPDVDTDNDTVPDAYSVQLGGLPLDKDIRVFLIAKGAIYPMYYDSDGNGDFDTNVFKLLTDTPIDLGFIDKTVPGEEGRAIPEIDPTDATTVDAGSPVQAIPQGVNEPPTDNLSLTELLDKGINALEDGWALGARTYFEEAVNEAGSSISNDADTARFLFAITRVIALGFDTLSDGNSVDMGHLGDIFDRLGVLNDEKRANWELISTPEHLPDDSPTGNEYRDFLYVVARPELISAIGNLDTISQAYNTVFDNLDDAGPVETDYGDVLLMRGLFKSTLATIAIQSAYNLDADIDDIRNKNEDSDLGNDITVEDFLGSTQAFLTLTDTTKLTEAKGYLTASALDDLDMAIDTILAETDPQDDDFITIDPTTDTTEVKNRIAEVKDSILNGVTAVGSATLDLKQFFDVGVDFRSPSELLPPFTDNDVSGLFLDPTFTGVVLAPDLNEDVDPADGVPDILQ